MMGNAYSYGYIEGQGHSKVERALSQSAIMTLSYDDAQASFNSSKVSLIFNVYQTEWIFCEDKFVHMSCVCFQRSRFACHANWSVAVPGGRYRGSQSRSFTGYRKSRIRSVHAWKLLL